MPRKVEPLMSTIWAVTDFTRENGATQIVPGSHKWDKDRLPNEDEIAYAEMTAGSVYFTPGLFFMEVEKILPLVNQEPEYFCTMP